MPWNKRIGLGFRFWRNTRQIKSGTSWRAHLLMAMKLLEMGPEIEGAVIECGCWKGGATVNLSIICAIVGRKLKVYDSFEGLPPPTEGDPIAEKTFAKGFIPGLFGGSLDEVKGNIERFGEVASCSFHPGWFEHSLPHHEGEIAMMFLDVDFYSSLHECLIHLWPYLAPGGILFLDEYTNLPYCAVFYSEKYWQKYFSCAPPGLLGVGTGVQLGKIYWDPDVRQDPRQIHSPESVAFCIKGTQALWDFYPDEMAEGAQAKTSAAP
ncbi:MAG: hypothetical protein HN744_12945 [Halieaceae bacterium]|nr:hypothetical protein [Halieaceae bacterium]